MSYSDFLSGILNSCWSVFSIELPLIGLTGKQIILGSFAVIVGISVLKSILSFGLVSGGFKSTMNSGYKVGTNIGNKIYEAKHKQVNE